MSKSAAQKASGWFGLLTNVQSVLTALCGVGLVIALISDNHWIAYTSVAFGAYFALQSAWESIRERSIDVNFLMVFAAVGAVAVGHPEDAAALLFLFSLSSTLESIAMAKTRSAIEGLVRLRPSQAVRIRNGVDERVAVEELEIGDEIRIPAFESVAVDGEIVSGETQVDQSAMTGESVAVSKKPGELVLAGTQNLEGSIVVSVRARVGDSTLDKIVGLVQDAQENKASGERISQWFGQKYTFFVVGAFIVSLGIRSLVLGVPFGSALLTSLTLLVALSPCALVISVPASTLSALTWGARHGVLIRGGSFIESAGRIDTVVVDKTGTLTEGKPRLHEICLCSPVHAHAGGPCIEEEHCWRGESHMSDEACSFLRAAASAEQYSAHPIADAILHAARHWNLDIPEAMDQRVVPGLGVVATVDGKRVAIGQLRFIQQHVQPSDEFVQHTKELQSRGMTVALVAVDDQLAALGFQDSPREDAKSVLQDLQSLGIGQIIMLTGDNAETARAVAQEVGISEFKAGLMPDQKTDVVAGLVEGGRSVMMIGDGINDAPSLARATVGVAMGGLGSDIALNSADVVLMHDRLGRIADLIRLGRRTNAVIMANLLFATGVIAVLTITSLFFKLPLPAAVVGHEGSTVLVILNGLRLLRGPKMTR
jgi:Cd2+/Zn2+-exporting ATPase